MIIKQFERKHAEDALGGAEPIPHFFRYVQQMRVQGMSWSVDIDGVIVASGGLVPLWAGVGEAWMIAGDEIGKHRVKVSRKMRIMLDDVMRQRGIYRAHANIHCGFERAIRLAEWLGFENEGLMRRFGVEGADYFRYAKVTEWQPEPYVWPEE